MRIPNLNVSDSITRTIRDLELQRLKLDKQISTGQKISLPEDDGMRIGRVIQLDSEKGKLAQYQRNASYATEFINAGHINLDKLRELNLRAQEIARMAGNSLSEPAVEGFTLEANQLIEEALNRINAKQRGRSLFGGTEVKPGFSNSEILLGNFQKEVLNLDENLVGKEAAAGVRYLKQGDEIAITVNGKQFAVQAKVLDEQDFDPNKSYSKGDLVKITSLNEDSIQTNIFEDTVTVGAPTISDLQTNVLSDWSTKDWSQAPVGQTSDGNDVYLLDRIQIEKLALPLDEQPNVDRLPATGGYYSLVNKNGVLFLEPVKESFDDASQSKSYELTNGQVISYWEALDNGVSGNPFDGATGWIQGSPFDRTSNLSTAEAVQILKDLINSPSFVKGDDRNVVTDSYISSVKQSSIPDIYYNPNLEVTAKITENGSLELSGSVGQTFALDTRYSSRFDSENYFPNQLETILEKKAQSLYPGVGYDNLTQAEKDLVWGEVKQSKLDWELVSSHSTTDGNSSMTINHFHDWKRLEAYQYGDIVKYDGKIWESIADENFNHAPDRPNSEFWKELGSGYDQTREDWTVTNKGVENRFYFITPDGNLFENRLDAENHTIDLLIASSNRKYTDNLALFNDVSALVKEVSYAVAQFDAVGSESEGVVYFDARSQSHRLSAVAEGATAFSGSYFHGSVKAEGESTNVGDVVLENGTYFLLIDTSPSPASVQSVERMTALDSSIEKGAKVFIQGNNRLFLSLGDSVPAQGKVPLIDDSGEIAVEAGSSVYDRASDQFYIATQNIYDARSEDLTLKFSFLGDAFSPEPNSRVISLSDTQPTRVEAGDVVHNTTTGEYFEALIDADSVTTDDLVPKFISSSVFNSQQGSEWSSNRTYNKGQIVLYRGVYYECQTDGADGTGFNNQVPDNSLQYAVEPPPVSVRPDDEFFYETSDTISRQAFDRQIAKGEKVTNNVWLPVASSTDHIFSFTTENNTSSTVDVHSAGVSGVDAVTEVVTDVHGKISGIHIKDPGRYFFNINSSDFSVPEEYRQADILLPDGQSLKADIIWGENPNDPGPFVILGFEILDDAYVDESTNSKQGDSFSFATGSKTFLDHRNSNGDVISVTYTGSDENSEFYVGKDTKISSFLDAENGNTEQLASVVQSLIELRDGLKEDSPAELSRRVQLVENDLIQREDEVVDKIGELSSLLIRMESVRAYDEDYHQQLEQRLARDLDIDLSEAIMELTRVSTAYQAAMQVGAQLLNTSLLNYI